MARKPPEGLAAALASVRALRNDPHPEAGLRAALRAQGLVVAVAAEIVGERELAPLAGAVLEAWDRLYTDPVKVDPTCAGKAACALALDRLDHPDLEPFVRGLRYAQLEPAWGGPVDTASGLRARCALAAGRLGGLEALLALAPALADPIDAVRSAAAQALPATRQPAAAALLLLKLEAGDKDTGVVGDLLEALLELRPEAGLARAERFLDGPHREVATIALGRSRRAEALPLLLARHALAFRAAERHLYVTAVGLLRTDAARDWLLDQVRRAAVADARVAVQALATMAQTDSMRALVADAARGRDLDDDVAGAFR